MKLVNGNPSYERLNLPLNKMYLVSKNNKNLTLAKKLFKAIILVPKSKILSRSFKKDCGTIIFVYCLPISRKCSISIPPEDVGKTSFLTFPSGSEMED